MAVCVATISILVAITLAKTVPSAEIEFFSSLLVAYGRDFRGLESYVDTRLSVASEPVGDSVLLMAFAYYFGQVTLSLQNFASVFNLSASSLINLASVIPDHVSELLVEDDGGVRPAHYLIAEEILQQMLTRPGGDRRNWVIGLADLAIGFIDLTGC